MSEQIPVGAVPTGIKVQLYGSLAGTVKSGDIVHICGTLLVERTSNQSYNHQKTILAHSVQSYQSKDRMRRSEQHDQLDSLDIELELDRLSQSKDIYSRLANSIAPEIYGMEDVKKGLLLQLVSLPHPEVSVDDWKASSAKDLNTEKADVRKQLHILLIGDPGRAKSQLLKHISRIGYNSVYTTGKGSSAVGLTASIGKDPITKEMILDPGAVVLADMGICCLDEFDKMRETDKHTLHEVMEQQTVSIAKASIITRLNARTAILAAANPVLGRYNKRMSIIQNINLPPALFSRFDLVFVLLDLPNPARDMALCRHIGRVHRQARAEKLGLSFEPPMDVDQEETEFVKQTFEPVPSAVFDAYIMDARKIKPNIPVNLHAKITETYVTMRKQDYRNAKSAKVAATLTLRTLLSLLRLCHALAKIRMDNLVTEEDVEEAIRLFIATKADVEESRGKNVGRGKKKDIDVFELFDIVRDVIHKKYNDNSSMLEIDLDELEEHCLKRRMSSYEFHEVIKAYNGLGLFEVDRNNNTLKVYLR
eukprot:augustus_masked-scaffold_15-processed-gene-0.48-mRNA-1 protein AED:0.10 eAED:0.10 QI:0/-1/0/1/-1/1/1/0/534